MARSIAVTLCCSLLVASSWGCGDKDNLGGGGTGPNDGAGGVGAGAGGSGEGAQPSGGDGGGGAPSVTSAMLGTSGGTLSTPDGVVLVVPPGALDRETLISIARVESGLSNVVSQVFDLSPDGLEFAVPVELTIPFDPAMLGSAPEGELALAAIAPNGDRHGAGWALVDGARTTVTAHIMHFSQWAVVPAPPSGCTVNYECMKQCSGVDVPDLCCSQFKNTCRSRLTSSFPAYVACYATCVGTPAVTNFGSSDCMEGCCTAQGWNVQPEGTCYAANGSLEEAQAVLDCTRECFQGPDTSTLCGVPIQFDACLWNVQLMPLMGDECDGVIDGSGINSQFLFTDLTSFPSQDWGMPSVINVGSGSFDATSMTLPLTCSTAEPDSGSLTGTWNGSSYTGTWTFGASGGNVTIAPGWL